MLIGTSPLVADLNLQRLIIACDVEQVVKHINEGSKGINIALFYRRLQFVVETLQLQRSDFFMRAELPTLRLIIL